MRKKMAATDVIKFYSDLEKSGITIWIDGGWGVDALLGKQTRLHADLDIAIEQKRKKRLNCWKNRNIKPYRGTIPVPGILYSATAKAVKSISM